jgi:hypothetical protein
MHAKPHGHAGSWRLVAYPEVTMILDSRGISVSQKQLQILRRCAPLDDSAVGRLWLAIRVVGE